MADFDSSQYFLDDGTNGVASSAPQPPGFDSSKYFIDSSPSQANQPQDLTLGESAISVGKSMLGGVANMGDFINNGLTGANQDQDFMTQAAQRAIAEKVTNGEMTMDEGKQAITGIPKPTTLSSLLTSVIGSPNDLGDGYTLKSTPATRIIQGVASNALIPGGQLANAAAGGGAAIAHEIAPDSAIAPFVGAIGGGGVASVGEDLAGALKNALIGPQTEAGAAQTAAQTLAKISGTTLEDIQSAVTSNTGPLASSKTTAELLQSPQLATLEQAMGTVKPLDMAASAGERANAADNTLSSIAQDTTALKENTGSIILDAFNTAKQASKDNVEEAVKPLYGAAYENTPTVTDPALGALINKDQVLQSAIKAVQKTANNADLPINSTELLVKARSEIGNKIEQAILKGGGREARDLTDTYNRLNDILHQNDLLASADETYGQQIGAHNDLFNNGPFSRLSNAQGSQVMGNILATPEAATKAATILSDNPEAIQAIKDQVGTDMLNMSDAKRIAYVNSKESQLKTLLPQRDYEILDAIRNDAQLRIDTAKSGNPTGGSNTALKSLSLPSVIGRSIKGQAPPSGVWGQLVDTALKGAGTLAGGLATYTHPFVAIPAITGAAVVKGLRNRSTGLVQDALFNQLKDPEEFLSALNSGVPQQSVLQSTLKGVMASNPQALPALLNAVVGQNGGSSTPALRQALSTVLNNGGTKMNNPETPKILGADRVSPSDVIQKIQQDPVDHSIAIMESGKNLDTKTLMKNTDAQNAEMLKNVTFDPNAKNPESSASGIFQLLKGTADNLGVKDPFDPGQNYAGYLKLKEQNSQFGTDPATVYAVHYLGAPTYSKLLKGEPLTETQTEQVRTLKDQLLPKLAKIYSALALQQSGNA